MPHYTTIHCAEDEGRGQETLSIYLHNIVKIFASRLRLVRIFIVIARAGLGPRALGNKLCLSVYLSSSASVRSTTLCLCISHNCFHRVIQLPNCLYLACSEQRTKVNSSFFYLVFFFYFIVVGSPFFVPLITAVHALYISIKMSPTA